MSHVQDSIRRIEANERLRRRRPPMFSKNLIRLPPLKKDSTSIISLSNLEKEQIKIKHAKSIAFEKRRDGFFIISSIIAGLYIYIQLLF